MDNSLLEQMATSSLARALSQSKLGAAARASIGITMNNAAMTLAHAKTGRRDFTFTCGSGLMGRRRILLTAEAY
jgi:hypothetical protein